MGIEGLMELYKTYKKKKNKAIFVISFSFLTALIIVIYLLVQNHFNRDLSYSIAFVLLAGYLVFIMLYRSVLIEVLMKYHYYQMIHENLGLLENSTTIYTKKWLQFIEKEYIKQVENDEMIFYYQFHKKLNKLGMTGQVFVGVVVSKTKDYDFYNEHLNKLIEETFNNYKEEKRVKKQITIQFKKYQNFNDIHKEELQEIINFKNGDYVYINLPVGYFVEEDKVYFLRPKKQFSNKFYYYACQTAKYLSYIEDDENERQS